MIRSHLLSKLKFEMVRTSVVDPDQHDFGQLDPDPGERIWLTKKEGQKYFIFLKAGGLFLAEFFSWTSFTSLMEAYGLINCNFWFLKKWFFFTTVNFSNFWSLNPWIQTRIRNWIRIRIDLKCWIRIRNETNADPQHWYGKNLCCGSGMFIPDPRTLIFTHPGSRIHKQQQRVVKLLSNLFCSHKFQKI